MRKKLIAVVNNDGPQKCVFRVGRGVEVQKRVCKPPPLHSRSSYAYVYDLIFMYCSFIRYQGDCQDVEVDTSGVVTSVSSGISSLKCHFLFHILITQQLHYRFCMRYTFLAWHK